MSKLERQLVEDKALRDAARALVEADVERAKVSFSGKSLGKRTVDRLQDGAAEVFEQASGAADNNRGALALLIGAIVLWFARNPILALFFNDDELEAMTQDQGEAAPTAVAAPEGDPK